MKISKKIKKIIIIKVTEARCPW